MCVVRDLWEKCIIVTEQPLAKLF
uniref:Uncharacterized protein n=1 Tax=Bracon brevicornis TaxID=1563983 RepID=A0A6V7JBM3_9HYME